MHGEHGVGECGGFVRGDFDLVGGVERFGVDGEMQPVVVGFGEFQCGLIQAHAESVGWRDGFQFQVQGNVAG